MVLYQSFWNDKEIGLQIVWKGGVLSERTNLWANKHAIFAYPYPLSTIEFMKLIVMFFNIDVSVMNNHVKRLGTNFFLLLNNQLEVFPYMLGYLTVGNGKTEGHEKFFKSG